MSRFDRRLEWAAAALAVTAAVVVWAVTRTYPNYDSYYHLVWGRELLDGLTPSFEAYAAPTKHPLWVVVAAALGAAFGEGADRALVLACLLSHAALVLGTYRLGAAAFGRWAGLLGALFVAVSASFLLYAARGYVDMPFLALVVWAAVLVAEGRRLRVPFALLVLAGLLRPEAWVLSGLLWLWASRRVRDVAWVLAAPLIWIAVDVIATGDPLHSLNATTELADELGREQGLGAVPGSLVSFLAATARPPVAALGVLGVVLAWRVLGPRRAAVPLGLIGAGVATFVATGLVGLSILPRYLTVAAVALCAFAGYALAGFAVLPASDPRRRPWKRTAIGAGVLGAAVIAALAPSLSNVTAEVRFLRSSHDALVAVLDDPRVREAWRCGPITFPNYRLVPDARWHLDAPRGRVGARSARRRDRGVAIFVLTPKGLRRFGFADGASPLTNVPDAGFRRIAGNARFSALARCP